jgi:hypothetical protein
VRKVFAFTCKLFGKNVERTSIELVAQLWTTFLIVITHVVALFIVFEFELTHYIENYGAVLLGLSVVIFSGNYFYLVYKFKKWFS